ncbi:tetratricopeptide repeat protein, partial [Prochlorococcus marinus]
YRKAIELNPKYTEAHSNLGNVLIDLGKLKEAETFYRKAIDLNPNYAIAHSNLAKILQELGNIKEAELHVRKAIKLKPDFANAYYNLGNISKDLGNIKEAESSQRKAIKIKPNFAEAHSNLGLILQDLGKLKEAELHVRKAIEINPNYSNAYSNLGNILENNGKLKEAELYTRQAITLDPSHPDAHFNLAHILLKRKEFIEGWQEHESRWNMTNIMISCGNHLKTNKPEWEPERRGRLLLWPEQGLGDEIMFLSLVPDLIDHVDQLIIQTDPRLIPLLQRSLNQAKIEYIPKQELIDENKYDFHIAMGSLPKFLRNSLNDFKDSKQFILNVDQARSNQLREQLTDNRFQKIVGISWKSISLSKKNKSLSLEQFILGIYSPNIRFVCLQYGDVTEEIENIKQKHNIDICEVKEVDKFNDIDALSALIKACDEVVSIHNVTVPLAGALAVKTKVLTVRNNAWWWGIDDDESYWYPSIKLYRQSQDDQWEKALQQIKTELQVHQSYANKTNQSKINSNLNDEELSY